MTAPCQRGCKCPPPSLSRGRRDVVAKGKKTAMECP